jgi:glycosyltransferase involved in cell wall biosynthesis
MPQFVCILPVRDEADIIGQCLHHALQWSDAIYVFDTGSVDNTWEIVQDFAARDKRVVPLRKDPVYFSETKLRGWLFHQARQKLRTGDWFLRVDADEFHHVPPPEFVKTRLRPHETIVYHQYYNFALRASEVRDWEAGKESLADRARPIEERRQWYQVSVYAEPRLCRYRDTMQWPATVSFPYNAGYMAVERLPIRHYPHRDPVQLDRRCRLRAVMMADKENRANWLIDYHYWQDREWRNFITPDDAPNLKHWVPGSPLAEVHQTNHLAKPHVRIAQRLTHAFMLPLLDRRRGRWSEDTYPQRITPEVVALLDRELRD